MKWFLALNSGADRWFLDMVKVAVHTAQKYTSLEPHCIYDGDGTELSSWLEARHVNVHRFRVPFYDRLFSAEIAAANAGSAFEPRNASGIYLKLFINEFCEPNERFLFTDCDVMFTKDFRDDVLINCPPGFCAVPESPHPPEVAGQSAVFNSGVFISDEGIFSELRGSFLSLLEEHNFFFWGKPGFYDQGLLNIVFKAVWQPLDVRLNWRPFWGLNARPMIWHYHGAKPIQIERILNGKPDRIDHQNIIRMVNDNVPAYRDLLGRFKVELASVDNSSVPATGSEIPPVKASEPLADLCSFEFNGTFVTARNSYGADYLEEFKRVFDVCAPTEVLEWGAGTTTLLLAHLLDKMAGRIVTIDDNALYLAAVCAAVPDDVNLEAYGCSRMGPGRGQSDPELHYASFPASLGREFDFVYIDGRRRVECGVHALLCCAPNARIVVHDFRRARYTALLALYDVVRETKQFRVLAPNPAVWKAARNRFASSKGLFSPVIDGVSVKRVR